MESTQYPKDFWRGIPNKDFISNGVVLPSAFQFDDEIRSDGYKELSVNWNDNDESLEIALSQKKDNGKIQFPGGVAQLDLTNVELVLSLHIANKSFSYERQPIDGNPYHGNLLVLGSVNKQIRSLISSGLALVASNHIILQNNE